MIPVQVLAAYICNLSAFICLSICLCVFPPSLPHPLPLSLPPFLVSPELPILHPPIIKYTLFSVVVLKKNMEFFYRVFKVNLKVLS